MAERLEELPLFPLNIVVFPYQKVQVHVFEERYRALVQRCVNQDSDFGIVLIRSGGEVGEPAEPYLVGTACRIVKVQTLENGSMDVLVRGERRFRIRKISHENPYLVGYVEPLIEMEMDGSPRSESIASDLRMIFSKYLESEFEPQGYKVSTLSLPTDTTALSFIVADYLQCENIEKLHLLEMTDTIERIEHMLPILQRQTVIPNPIQRLSVEEALDWTSPN